MGNKGSRGMSYAQYYEFIKQQNGGNVSGMQFDLDGLDPYEVLNVRKNFTWDELKDAYRIKAKAVHPDKGGNEGVFNLVTHCFKELANEYKMKIEARSHIELKKDYEEYVKADQRPVATRVEKGSKEDEEFQKRFNRLFENNKLQDEEHDTGYGHIMTASSSLREDIEVPNTMESFNHDKFNKTFDTKVPTSKNVIVYKEPEPLQLAKSIQYTELGGKTSDYSSGVERSEKHSLQYTDYMKAHTTARLIHPNEIKQRKDYKTVEDYEIARSEILSKEQTDEEKQWLKEREEAQEKTEYERVQRLKHRDTAISKHYERVNGLLL